MAYKRTSPVPVVEGGTGALTLTGVLTGNGTSAITANAVTQYGTVVAGASNAVTSVAPTATAGIPLVSNGNAANPSYSTALIAGGGTAATSFNTNGVLISNTTSTGALAALSLTAGQVVIGSSTTPAAATLTPGSGISISNGNNSITISATGTTTLNYTSVNFVASPYTVLTTDDYLGVLSAGGAISILLPNAPVTGKVFTVKDTSGQAVTNNVTVTTVGGIVTIDGGTSFVMNTNYQGANFIFNGTSYEIY